MELSVVDNTAAHRFELYADDQLAASIHYREDEPNVFAFLHTETLPQFAGQGMATALVYQMLERLQRAGAQILPYCPFVNAYLREHPERVALVPPAERRRFGLPE